MNASTMKEIADKSISKRIEKTILELKNSILSAANKGEYFAFIDLASEIQTDSIINEVIKYFKEREFDVVVNDMCDFIRVNVYWHNA